MSRNCESCSKPFEAKRSTAKYCGETCRKRASRKVQPPVPVLAPEPDVSTLVAAVRAELQAADRLDTALGQQAVTLAERMTSQYDTGSAVASVSKELRAVMDAALANAATAADALDELSARRRAKASSA